MAHLTMHGTARQIAAAILLLSPYSLIAQPPTQPQSQPQPSAERPKFDAFDVATIKPVGPDEGKGRFITMQDAHRFVAKDYTLKLLIAAAYDLNPKTISGGPNWIESDHYNIVAVTPGEHPGEGPGKVQGEISSEIRPTRNEQMTMLRALLVDRFKLTFHREAKEFSIFELQVSKDGPKLKPTAAPDTPPSVGPGVVYPQRIVLPGRNATMGEFASLLQRAILDRPVVDKTGLSGRYDFDFEWAPDETQFGGDVPVASADAPSPPLFRAIQDQLGLRLVPTHGPVNALVVDSAERPSPN
ncbi:TIGR03435 family protein [Acidicapsa ligni]|uniref:TIGR03435 family protein n=1 Tax=Acidicapsa ligni TaxID=542300 RepID=UPI0021DFD99F|nr:TIGR03435 family protein [Acidicapsa ligni]